MNVIGAWKLGYTGKGVVVSILVCGLFFLGDNSKHPGIILDKIQFIVTEKVSFILINKFSKDFKIEVTAFVRQELLKI